MADPSTRFHARLNAFAGVTCGVLLIAFTGLVLYSVVMRYFFSRPPIWGEDVPKLMFVWLSFVGSGLAYLLGFNIRMTSLIERVPLTPRRIIEVAMHLMIVAMLVVILWYSLPILQLASRNRVLSTGLSDIWTYLPLPIGCLLLLANEALRITRIVRGGVDDSGSDPHDAV